MFCAMSSIHHSRACSGEGMAALLVELVKLTPVGFAELREKDPDEALELLAEGDELVRPLIAQVRQRRAEGVKTGRAFDDLDEIDDLREALRLAAEEGRQCVAL